MDGYGLDFSLRSLLRLKRSSLTFLSALVCALEILFSSSESDAMGFFTYSSTALHPATDESANFISFVFVLLIRNLRISFVSLPGFGFIRALSSPPSVLPSL